jgi:opacity protein-like surface antigen
VRRLRVLAPAFLFALAASRAGAQGTSGLHFGFEGGVSYPQGDTKDFFDNGWNGGALLVWNPPVIPVGLRVDGAYHTLDAANGAGSTGDAKILAGTADVVVGFRALLLKPYVFGGIGYYRLDFSDSTFPSTSNDNTKNETGWNAGAGVSISLRKVDLIIEARYHSIGTSPDRFKFVPVSIGLVF